VTGIDSNPLGCPNLLNEMQGIEEPLTFKLKVLQLSLSSKF